MMYYAIWGLIFLCSVFMIYIIHKNIADVLIFLFLFLSVRWLYENFVS